ncbi:MAG: hypothetical protein ACXWYS_00660 [Gaiellaceae bacterium]
MWEGERLRKRTEEGLAALRAEVEERSATRGRRRSLFGRLRADIELDEDAATVVAMSAAGATLRQIARYTALEPSDVARLLRGDGGGPAARAERRTRLRLAADKPSAELAAAEDIAQAS